MYLEDLEALMLRDPEQGLKVIRALGEWVSGRRRSAGRDDTHIAPRGLRGGWCGLLELAERESERERERERQRERETEREREGHQQYQ